MNLDLENFFKENSLKKYYRFTDDIIDNTIEKLFIAKDKYLLDLMNTKYDIADVCAIINDWIDSYNYEIHSKWYPFAHKDIDYISIDMDIVESFRSINYWLLKNIKDIDYDQTLSYIFIYCGFELYYKKFCEKIVYNQDQIRKLYSNKIDDKNFIQYSLISISDKRKFKDDRIFDEENNKTIHLCVDNELLKLFHKMIDDKSIKNISFRSDDRIEEGWIPNNTLCEGVSYGTLFNLRVPNLSKKTILFSDLNYGNQLWVFADKNSVTFEELLEDFKCDDNSIVTQMIHLEYFYEDGSDIPYISHIDKENIFYTEEEYQIRLNNNIKGKAKKREKFFKIDNSRIKFDYPCSIIDFKNSQDCGEKKIPFIYYIVRHYFKNSDVVDEYFSKL